MAATMSPTPQAGTVDHAGLEVLDEVTCRRLLASAHVARLGLSERALPMIVPVNVAVSASGEVLLVSGPGAKLEAARRGDVVCIEADRWFPFAHAGWSVVAVGRLEIVPPEDEGDYADVQLEPWARVEERHLLRIRPQLWSGRRLSALGVEAAPST
jgi:nitroimidazol reductase NimA-like FMN-containing flavoprotein (pyridoxamine 5'-phosphate oxidase superfamily)